MNSLMKGIFLTSFLFMQTIFSEEKVKLLSFSHNYYSQYGEDGIVNKIFEIIGTESKVCLEVGAGEGVGGSNVSHLWKDLGWRAILIEGDPEKFEKLESTVKGYDNCTLVKSYIEKNVNLGRTIDSIIQDLGINQLDILSLDVDGNDYHIFESLKIRPRVMIIEFNHTIPYYRDVYQQYSGHSWEIGCSVASLKRLGKQKGYELVAVTDVNAIFVQSIYFEKFNEYETSLEKLFNTKYLKNIIHSYSGEPIVVAKKNYLSDSFFKVGYQKKMNCEDCYVLRINEVELNDEDFNNNFPGCPKIKPVN